ncbi:LRR receptor-like kinase family protein [Quillaja saponaria]|uniref:LRR receptor-like kinase family protein n=1 Tax=Quillaja saponaria TaxID=32244 RepID=A0AAD7PE83_QUISA|nr:LRR receptor-like kinase family protein [Quillaja saponaria]
MRRLGHLRLSHALLCSILCLLSFIPVSPATEKEILLQFKGNITDDPYSSLRSWIVSGNPCEEFGGVTCNSGGFIERIVLWNTSLAGVLSSALSGLKSLRILTLFGNRFSGNIPQEYSDIHSLWKINLSSNALSGSIPEFIGDLPNIRFLDLSKNGFKGEMPSGLFKYCYKTKFISLSHNSLSLSIPSSIVNCSNLEGFDFSFNNLSGEIPSGICDIPVLSFMSLRSNVLSGRVQEQILACQSLNHLDLSSNLFTGSAPFDIIGYQNLTYFNVSHNAFNGEIPELPACSEGLEFLDASENELDGEIPSSIIRCRNLKVLNLELNRLNGSIPVGFRGLERLLVLQLGNNSISGTIPEELGNIELLQVLNLHNLNLAGEIPGDLSNCRFLLELDVSGNALEGEMPRTLYNMTYLEVLDIHQNHLNGSIPPSLGNLSKIQHNSSNCEHPGVCLVSIMNIRARTRKKGEETVVIESTPLGSTDSNVIIGKLVLFSKSLPSKYEDWEAGTKALLDKECLIGGGSIGKVYRTDFEVGISIAVKKLETLGRITNQDEFEHEIGRLGNLRHPNLVALQGYYWSSTMQLILSEFVPNRNLYDSLHGLNYPGTSTSSGNSELYWSRRFQIALGTARALSYLHHDCRPPILHLNIKSTNILLDEKYEAKLSDYGLVKLLPVLDNYGLTKFHTAVGYVAPELAQCLRPSEKCDVYSFGVILLELVTGRKPVESPTVNEVVVLCEYVRRLLEKGSASACFDRRLRGFAENELIQVVRLGLTCTSEAPSRRPSMIEVIQVLESIRNGLG